MQMVWLIKGFSCCQVVWFNFKYVIEDVFEKVIVEVINIYNKFDLLGYWGSGKSVLVDGIKWSVYEDNLLLEYYICYGGYGGIGYYYVFDKYVVLFSYFIFCGVYEGIYIFDGLLVNMFDIQFEIVYGDMQV